MKIALISSTNSNKITGRDNNVRSRISYLNKNRNIDMDVYYIRYQDDFLLKLLFKRKEQIQTDIEVIDGIKCKNIWLKYTFFDAFLTYILKTRDIICKKQLDSQIVIFSKYDIILAHSLEGKYIAYKTKTDFAVPYINGWHGSDLNIMPYRSKKIKFLHKVIIENADYNLFVSKELLMKSDEITKSNNKGLSYSGISPQFISYDKFTKQQIRKKYNIRNDRYIVGFVGRLLPIKNVFILPQIFKELQGKLDNVDFVIVGDGNLEAKLRKQMKNNGIKNCSFLGKIEPNYIPEIMNCIDVLVLPSFNEGLPLVALEAIACGTSVVGSKVGGTPEAIGEHNVFPLGPDFVEKISNRIIEILTNHEPAPILPSFFSWEKTIDDVVQKCKEILLKKKKHY